MLIKYDKHIMSKIRKVDKRKSHLSILVKPTHDCNFDCSYCYEKPMREKYRNIKMSYKTIDKILGLLSRYAKRSNWIWHGGEPTLMGANWYKNVQEIFYKYDDKIKINQSLQTNGSLLNKDWALLNKDYKIDIGVSYDATGQDVRNTIYDIKHNIINFISEGGKCGGIAVINNENYKNQIDIYEEYKNELKMSCSMNYIFRAEKTKELSLEMSIEDFIKEYRKLLEHWIYDYKNPVSERGCLITLELVFGKVNRLCTYTDCRKKWICVNGNGDIYPCDRYLPLKYKMGNIHEDVKSIDEFYNSNGFKLYYMEIEQRLNTHCKECGYLSYCNGGCNANHIIVSGSGSGVDKNACDNLRNRFNETYDVIREIDIYQSKLNTFFMNVLNDKPVLTLLEIKNYLKEKGFDTNWKYTKDGREMLECQEFKMFRVFNPILSLGDSQHSDKINYSSPLCSDKKYKELRKSVLDKRFLENYETIIKILRNEVL